jgi:hypothetical protein
MVLIRPLSESTILLLKIKYNNMEEKSLEMQQKEANEKKILVYQLLELLKIPLITYKLRLQSELKLAELLEL